MTWTCHKCGTTHDSTDKREWCRRNERDTTIVAITALVLIALIIGALKLAHAQLAYGDWTCAFAECRRVIQVRGEP